MPQEAYNSNRFKKKNYKSEGNRNQIEITCPRSNSNSVAEPQMKPETSGSSLVPCPNAGFFPQEAVFPSDFTAGREVMGVTLCFPFWSFFKTHLDNCSVQASLNYESAEITENTANVPVFL